MKRFTIAYLFLILFLLAHQHSDASIIKCRYSFDYRFSSDTLYMSSYLESDDYCGNDFENTPTQVVLGDGETMAWTGTWSTFYVYHCNGNFHVLVTSSDFAVANFSVSVTDIPFCELSFVYHVSYYTASGIYRISCIKTDSCPDSLYYWNAGAARNYGSDSVTFLYPKQEEGSTIQVCLQRNYACSGNGVCKSITLSPDQATIIDEPTDESPVIRFSPNPVYNNLQVEIVNLKETIQVKIYSVDGVERRNMHFSPIEWHSDFIIDLNGLPAGIYFVKAFASGQNSSVEKIMKQ